MAPTASPKRRIPPLVNWMRGLGAAGLAIGCGSLLMSANFWIGAVLTYLGFAAVVVDIWLEPRLINRRKWQAFSFLLVLAAVAAFSGFIVFVDAPLNIAALVTDGEYKTGSSINGIVFRPEFTELRLSISNPSRNPYEDLRLLIKPKEGIAAISQVDGPTASFQSPVSARVMMMDKSGNTRVMSGYKLLLTNAGYEMHCDRLSPGTSINIAIALAEPKQKQNGPNYALWNIPEATDVFASRPKDVRPIDVTGEYKAVFRTRSLAKQINVFGKIPDRQDMLDKLMHKKSLDND